MALPGRRSGAHPRRRSGPAGEEPWWDPDDQRLAERVTFRRVRLPRRWKRTSMFNNVEVLDPYEGLDGAAELERARVERCRTALVEGEAWRGPDRQLAVLRVEAFADRDVDAGSHRAAWQRDGEAVLLDMWKKRWTDREVEPGFIEVGRRTDADVDPGIDWFRIEDHTNRSDATDVKLYQHLTMWAGRGVAVVTVRHQLGVDADEIARWFGDATLSRLAWAFDPADPAPPSP